MVEAKDMLETRGGGYWGWEGKGLSLGISNRILLGFKKCDVMEATTVLVQRDSAGILSWPRTASPSESYLLNLSELQFPVSFICSTDIYWVPAIH